VQPIAWINSPERSRQEFAESIRPLFEAAAPLAPALYAARPFASYESLIDRAEALAENMPRDQQVGVLAAHPRIGADPSAVSALSYREQGYAAEGGGNPAELERTYARLKTLNHEYEERFGFRFVVFVNKRPKAEIVQVLESRLRNAPDDELRIGLREMFRIARARATDSMAMPVHEQGDDPARLAVLDELRRRAIDTYGEERAAEVTLQAMLRASATAIWRISQEPLEPSDPQP
jgi:2-oxo-4-hydroxy-4-carboxy--5-ureidoimidazoline (OHCU) decarboxylase